MVLLPIIVPIISGAAMIFLPEKMFSSRKMLINAAGALFIICALLSVAAIAAGTGEGIRLFEIVKGVPICLFVDRLGSLFAGIAAFVFVLVGFFSLSYMKHEENEQKYYGFYLITFGIVTGLCFSQNMITFYFFYEFMTLAAMPLVLHEKTREAIMAGLKYLLFSFCGAYMALFGIYFLSQYKGALYFTPGGALDISAVAESGNMGMLLASSFLMIIGFGVKAGMFPMHSWLATAHPVAPSPASAFLSGIIVKAGILAIIRAVYYCIGTDVLRNTWVQTSWIILSTVTVIMGSALAFKEKILKKRLAYSTVSNLSYIMLGLSMFNMAAFTGSLLHVAFHAVIKSALFMSAGALYAYGRVKAPSVLWEPAASQHAPGAASRECLPYSISSTGKTRVNDFAGLAKKMPVLFWCYTIVSLGLIGIPPASGFWSKWHIALGCMEMDMGWLGAAALLISALLTAGYLLPISIKGFLYESEDGDLIEKYQEPERLMLAPVIIAAGFTILFGIYPEPLVEFIKVIWG